MTLFLRTFSSSPKLRPKSYGTGREWVQRANLVAEPRGVGNVFEFRFDEADGHLPPATLTALSIDHFTLQRERRKLSNGGEVERLYLGLDPRGDYTPYRDGDVLPLLAVQPWDDVVARQDYGDRVVYRQQVQLVDLATMDGFPFEVTASDPVSMLKSGNVYSLGHANFRQAAYGGLRIDPRSAWSVVTEGKKRGV